MIVKILIIAVLLTGCPGKSDRPTPEKSPSPPPSDTNRDNQDGAGRGGGGGGQGATGTNVADDDDTLDPNDTFVATEEKEEEEGTEQSDPSQSPSGETDGNTSQHTVAQTTQQSTQKSPTETVEQQETKESTTKTVDQQPAKGTGKSPTAKRQPSPTASLFFIEQDGHLLPALEFTDATALSDLEISRPAHDFAINNGSFASEVTKIPQQTYFIKLKVQDRQCNNTVEVTNLTQTITFKMNCP